MSYLTMIDRDAAPRAIIFDMDGLLLDTEVLYTRVQEQITAEHGGKPFTMQLKSKMMGQKALDAAKLFVTELGLQDKLTPEAFVAAREVLLDEMFERETALMPGAEALLCRLHESGFPIALATSSHRRHYVLKTSRHRALFDRVFGDRVVTGDEVSRGKPDKMIFERAAGLLDVPLEDCVVFEDAVSGVEAAKRGGAGAVMIPDPAFDRDEYTSGADFVWRSLDEVDLPALGISLS